MDGKIILSVLIGIIVLGLIGFSEDALADESSNEPREYEVLVSLISVGEINKHTGSYELDFWYSIKSEGIDLKENPPPQVDFINGKNLQYPTDPFWDSDIFETRVQGTFVGPMDFRDFPFEKIHLRVELEPETPHTIDSVVLSVDSNSGIDATANIPGWFMSEPIFEIKDNTYGDGETFSRYVADFTVERSPLGSFLKILFPVLIVVGISFLAYIIPENYDIGLEYSLLPLIAVIFLHIDTVDQLPPLGYLTIFDKVILIAYALIANNIIALGREVRVSVHKGAAAAQYVNNFHLKITPVIAIVLGVVFFFV